MSLYAASTPFGTRLIDDGAELIADASREAQMLLRAKYRGDHDRFAIPGYDDRPETPEKTEPDRPASRLTAYIVPNDPESYALATTRVKLAQWIRVSGLRGVAVLERKATARGTATRNVPNHLSGMPPAERRPLIMASDDETLSEPEVRQLRRYRNAMKGEKFAASMAREERERTRAYWRAALPFWPLDKAGRFESGKRRTNPETGRETLRFLDGSYLDDRIEQHKAMRRDECEAIESKRERTLRDLIAEQEADMEEDRKRTRKVRTTLIRI